MHVLFIFIIYIYEELFSEYTSKRYLIILKKLNIGNWSNVKNKF